MTGKKLQEARRLKKYFDDSMKPNKATIIKLSNTYLVSFIIKSKPFSYEVNLSSLHGTVEERNNNFARYICEAIMSFRRK